MTCHDSPRLLAYIRNSYDITIGHTCDCDLWHHNTILRIAQTKCTPGTVARIFIDSRTLHMKRLSANSNSAPTTNVPYPYHYKKRRCVPYFLAKIEVYCIVFTYRTVMPFLLLVVQLSRSTALWRVVWYRRLLTFEVPFDGTILPAKELEVLWQN